MTGLTLLTGAGSLAGGQLIKLKGAAVSAREGFSNLGRTGKIAAGSMTALAGVGLLIALKSWSDQASKLKVNLEAVGRASDEELAQGFLDLEASLAGTDGALDAFRQTAEGNIVAATRMRDALAATGRDTSDLDAILRDAAEGQRQMQEDSEGTDRVLNRLLGTEKDTVDATGDLEGATDDASRSFQDLKDDIDDAVSSLGDFFDETMSQEEAQLRLDSAMGDLRDTLKDTEHRVLDTTDAGRDLRSAIMDATEGIIDWGIAQIEAGRGAEWSRDRVLEKRNALIEELVASGMAKDAAEEYVDQLGLTPQNVTTQFNQVGLAEARAEIDYFISRVNSLDGRTIDIRMGRLPSGETFIDTSIPGTSGRAHGGPVSAGRAYTVGEKGPETFIPTASGTILPNGVTGGSSITINVNASGGADGHLIGEQIVAELVKHKRRVGSLAFEGAV